MSDRRILLVSPAEFHDAVERAMGPTNPMSAFISHYSIRELEEMLTFLSESRLAGIAVKDHGDGRIEGTALFNAGGRDGMGQVLLQHAVKTAMVNYLECFGDGLRILYERNGFSVESVSPFNDAFAPPNWDYDKLGRPSYYTMRRLKMDFTQPKTKEAREKAVRELLADPDRVHDALKKEIRRARPGISRRELEAEMGIVEATLGF